MAQRDGLFAGHGLDDGVTGFLQTADNVQSQEEFVLDHENNG